MTNNENATLISLLWLTISITSFSAIVESQPWSFILSAGGLLMILAAMGYQVSRTRRAEKRVRR